MSEKSSTRNSTYQATVMRKWKNLYTYNSVTVVGCAVGWVFVAGPNVGLVLGSGARGFFLTRFGGAQLWVGVYPEI